MQDRPNVDELLEAVTLFLRDDVMAHTQGRLNFHARVAANVLDMLRRELSTEEELLEREWSRLDAIQGIEERPARLADARKALIARNDRLAAMIRAGEADEGPARDRILAHLRATTYEKLTVSDPRLAATADGGSA